jgi:hypothetical protein
MHIALRWTIDPLAQYRSDSTHPVIANDTVRPTMTLDIYRDAYVPPNLCHRPP